VGRARGDAGVHGDGAGIRDADLDRDDVDLHFSLRFGADDFCADGAEGRAGEKI